MFLNINDDDLQTLVKGKEDFIINVTKRYNIKCTFVRINENNYHSLYLMFTKKPFLSYHLFVLNDTYYLSLVSQDKCVLYQITKLFFLINLLQNFTKIKLLPSDENSHAFLSENEFGLSFKFVSQDPILLIQNCVSRLIQASKMNLIQTMTLNMKTAILITLVNLYHNN
ncbi:hypothetical protein TRFO_22027 [Tritrichomonas foetus]|uniref:Uncharacterized protein n=1 Tax=Tritrichomonas foetus TaxID=1144522 RepID=A0A1J4KDC2_9EUKA|nr:hypothetical protein TRFO_22027 [Tritrichomonas foetus]|eukprot:OHT09195.1 hypothetical protein TRFO_22027 [Tritrichomonas foetus]